MRPEGADSSVARFCALKGRMENSQVWSAQRDTPGYSGLARLCALKGRKEALVPVRWLIDGSIDL